MGAYQSTNFAYQGSGLFAYQTTADVLEPAVIVYGGDDAPRKRARRKERRDLFREIEQTVHALLHPPADVAVSKPVEVKAKQAVDELLVLAQGQHDLLQRAARLRSEVNELESLRQRMLEQDEEDAMLWMF